MPVPLAEDKTTLVHAGRGDRLASAASAYRDCSFLAFSVVACECRAARPDKDVRTRSASGASTANTAAPAATRALGAGLLATATLTLSSGTANAADDPSRRSVPVVDDRDVRAEWVGGAVIMLGVTDLDDILAAQRGHAAGTHRRRHACSTGIRLAVPGRRPVTYRSSIRYLPVAACRKLPST